MRALVAAPVGLALAACATQPSPEEALAGTEEARRAFMDCAAFRASALARRVDEPADVVAIAAIADCVDEQLALGDALAGVGYGRARVRELMEDAETIVFKQMVALVVRLRARAGRPEKGPDPRDDPALDLSEGRPRL